MGAPAEPAARDELPSSQKYAGKVPLDHRPLIQLGRVVVIGDMQLAVPCLDPPPRTSLASRMPNATGAAQRLACMPSDKTQPLEAPQWEVLIRAIATDQDRDAFARLFEFFAPRVKAFMQRSGLTSEAAEDLAQETMINVWRKADLFDPGTAGAPAWIYTIARNLRIDAYRRNYRGIDTVASDFHLDLQVDHAPQPDAVMTADQEQTQIRSALRQLSPEQLQVVELSFFEQRPHADIAVALGIPLGTVKSRLRLAMHRLRDLLDGLS
jgi:RNA polymerase sigma-70 factor (ECF subfamily)